MSGQSPAGAALLNGTAPSPSPSPALWSHRSQQATGSSMFIAGIVLLGVIALGLALFFYVVKRRQAREVERLQQQREARRRRAAERRAREALEAEQRVASIPIKSVVPVFIMQPDGRLILAAHTAFELCGKEGGGVDDSDDGSEPKPPPPMPRTGSMRRSRSFPWRRQLDDSAAEVELPGDSNAAGQQQQQQQEPPPPPV